MIYIYILDMKYRHILVIRYEMYYIYILDMKYLNIYIYIY